jgi:hypothetical protein
MSLKKVAKDLEQRSEREFGRYRRGETDLNSHFGVRNAMLRVPPRLLGQFLGSSVNRGTGAKPRRKVWDS